MAELHKSKYGLTEYSFEIGSIDDSSETVAIVGKEYSNVHPWDVFHSKEDVEAYIAEKEEQHKHEVSLLLVRLAEKDKEINILQQSLQSSETVSAYRKRTIKEYEVKVDRMGMDIAEKDRYISNLKDDVVELQAKYRDCKRELGLLKDTLAFYRGE